MCTATYLPTSPNGFILTHSRDEKAIRPAARPPKPFRVGGQDVTFPQDPQGQGTWIAAGRRFGSAQTTVCLLNGAFRQHQHQPPYKHSRGLVIPHFFEHPSVEAFSETYDFAGIEPFTLLVVDDSRLIEIKWNGKQAFIHEKDPQKPHIWSSVTLYPPDVVARREGWFQKWIAQNPAPSVKDVRQFHQTAGDGDAENSLLMNRQNALLTISLTSIVHDGEETAMIYEDFMQHTFSQQTIRHAYATA